MRFAPKRVGTVLLGLAFSSISLFHTAADDSTNDDTTHNHHNDVMLFLCGDVMTGRGIDQIFSRSVAPRLYEPYVKDARDYVAIAEEVSGVIPRNVDADYIWGQSLGPIRNSDAKIINLETSITYRGAPWPGKGIHYRMHPANTGILVSAGIDCCVLSNNHILDWGYAGLADTVRALKNAGISTAGAGGNHTEAVYPAVIDVAQNGRNIIVVGVGLASSGIPREWETGPSSAGVHLAEATVPETIEVISKLIRQEKRSGDIAVASVHWGGNWGYEIPSRHIEIAHALIDDAAVDIVHGHSSHHPKGIEVYRDRLILYGCGDFINDYEGISGHDKYRTDIVLGYFPTVGVDGALESLIIHPYNKRKFSLAYVSTEDAEWTATRITRISRRFGSRVVVSGRKTQTGGKVGVPEPPATLELVMSQ